MEPKQLSQQPIKIIIADDHDLLRIGFKSTLETEPLFQLVAEAANGEQLIRLTELYDPDIVLTDIQMPVLDGIAATKIITDKFPRTLVIAFSVFTNEYLLAEMLHAGAMGFVSKQAPPPELVKAIMAVYNNQYYYCSFSSKILNTLIANKEYNPVTKERNFLLTPREKEVLILICKQKTNKDISMILKISVRTVEDFRSNLLIKTRSKSVAGLVTYALKYGIYVP